MQFTIEARPYDDADVVAMVEQVQAEYVVRYGGPDEAVFHAADFVPPAGLFLVGLADGGPVAMGGWRRESGDPSTAEIKRMYVAASARRRGFARAMLAELERSAAEAGVARLILNTGTEQPEAIALYESAGWHPIAGFGIYASAPQARFYGKELVAAA